MLLLERHSNLSFLGLLSTTFCQQQEAWRTGLLRTGKWVILPYHPPTVLACGRWESAHWASWAHWAHNSSCCSLALIPFPVHHAPSCPLENSISPPLNLPLILASFQDSIQVPSLESLLLLLQPSPCWFHPHSETVFLASHGVVPNHLQIPICLLHFPLLACKTHRDHAMMYQKEQWTWIPNPVSLCIRQTLVWEMDFSSPLFTHK